ncbi:mitochondrial thiamine pyrophosphate carrier-like [Oscarella lobularis]|uniref:mitochondrial thiamine pyrophosphate carrier-like n=1 Tax=Oscarella lobularis TaxID=121494 RepID=UPI00331379CD
MSPLSSTDYAIAGAVSGIVTRAFVSPLDVLKIRFQLQIEPISRAKDSKYRGLWHGLKVITKEEGVLALWKGHVPGQMLSIIYGSCQFVSFEYMTAGLSRVFVLKERWKPVLHFVCGGVAGCLATIASQPVDVLRTRMVSQGREKVYRHIWHASTSMYRTEGFYSFYRGLVPTLLQIFPYSGFQFGFYSFFKTLWDYAFGLESKSSTRNFVCGALSGICSKSLVLPLDMAKKRLQVQGFEEARRSFGAVEKYSSLRHCFQSVVANEGTSALFKGFVPSLIKAALSAGLIFFTYEECCSLLREYKTMIPFLL